MNLEVFNAIDRWAPPAAAARPFREAAGVTVDDDEDQWRPLTTDGRRDLSPLTQRRMQELAVYLWKGNPLANRLIELPLAFLLANGVALKTKDEEAQRWLDLFWRDPINKMAIKLEKKVRELSLFGEQCWPAFVNEHNGHVRLGYIDPAQIETVVTDPDNIEQPIGVVLCKDKKGRSKRYRIIVNGPEAELFTQRTQDIRATFEDGPCFYFNVNGLSSANRGHSDLLPQMDWIDGYDKALFGELDRWDYQRAFLWDVTLKGATEDQVKARAGQIAPPAPGSVRVHNDQEVWETVSPELQSGDTTSFARLFRTHIMGGSTIPEHWYGAGGDVNRATAQAMDEPTLKIFQMRQALWKHILEEIGTFVVHQRAIAIYGGRPNADEQDYLCTAEFPEMVSKDLTKLAAALQSVVVALTTAVSAGLMSEETAVAALAVVASQLGVEIDAKQELERARAAAERKKAEDSFSDFGDGAPATDATGDAAGQA